MKNILALFIFTLVMISCKKNIEETVAEKPIIYTNQFTIANGKIYNFNNPIQLIGVNAFHSFGASSSNDMNVWKIDIAREFVGNVKEQPISGYAILDSNGVYLHSLQAIVDSNRKNNRITILCPFKWNGISSTDFSGKRPSQTYWFAAFKNKLALWALQFKTQKDVWIELWNEPYRYDRTDGYTDDVWLSDMNELTSVIRSSGNENIILVPCAEQGQDESVLINKGTSFLIGKSNILFDIHAYEKWLLVPNANMGSRLQQLKQNNLSIFFGELAPMNAGTLMNPKPFVDSIYSKGISCAAWAWKYDGTDTDALLTINGLPNNNNNNNWGSLYKSFCLQPRNP